MIKALSLAVILGGGAVASDVPVNPSGVASDVRPLLSDDAKGIYQKVLSIFCSKHMISHSHDANQFFKNLKIRPLNELTLDAIVALYPPQTEDQRTVLFRCIFNSKVDVLKYALSLFDRIFGDLNTNFFQSILDANPDWYPGYYQKEPILKKWLEERKTPEDRRREEEARQAEERRKRDEEAQKKREEQEMQRKLSQGLGGRMQTLLLYLIQLMSQSRA